jgi:hypothetical protein
MAKDTKKNSKKDSKKKGKKEPQGGVEAVRDAVERTFAATAEGAEGARERTRGIVDEVTAMAARFRETMNEMRVADDLKALRTEIEALSRRVAQLEQQAAKPAARSGTTRRTTASRAKSTSGRSTAAKSASSRSTAAKSTGTRSTAAKRTTAAKRSTSRGSGSSGSSS